MAAAPGKPSAGPTVDVPAGVTSFTVRVPTVDDSISEGDETITLSAGTPQNAAPVVGTGTIVDNEGAPTINISGPAIVDEAAGTATYTVTLSHASAGPVTVDYASADGSATAGSDYDATSGTLSFAPGTTSLTITVPITNDNLYEGGETYTVNLSNATGGASIGTASVSTEIVDDGRPSDPTDPSSPPVNDDRPQVTQRHQPERDRRRRAGVRGDAEQPQRHGHHRHPHAGQRQRRPGRGHRHPDRSQLRWRQHLAKPSAARRWTCPRA
jgi:hypothetical protein